MTEIKVGDEVQLLQQSRRARRIPQGGYRGTVTKTGRRYATAVFDAAFGELELSFDMETGIVRADTEGLYVQTPEQIDREARRKEAIYLLGLAGLEFKLGHAHFLTLEQLEQLAGVVKTWDQED